MSRDLNNPRYLGDGVYCGCDGQHVVLRLGRHDNKEGEICLEDSVAFQLVKYIQETFKKDKTEWPITTNIARFYDCTANHLT